MKLRTSFFNLTVLRKDITRFAPAWGLYLTGMLLLMLTLFPDTGYNQSYTVGMTISLFSAVNICYALVCAALLFGDLFNARLCNSIHAMPMRREGWFLTHLVSGLLFSIVPNLIVALCLMPRLVEYWFVSFVWLGGMTATYLFFFGAAVLSAMCTGSRFAMTLVYGLINFLSILAMWMMQFLYEPLLFGIEIDQEPFVFLSPVVYLCTNELNFVTFLDKIVGVSTVNGWPYVLGIAGVGAVMLAVALLLYRKRHLETAGNFVTVRALSPVFLVLYTLTAGMILFLFSNIFAVEQGYLFLAVGIAVGFITGRMLLKRTVRVFKPATFVGLAVMMLVIFGSFGLMKLDVLGVVRWIPEQEDVKSVSIRYAYDDYAYTADDAAEIAELMELHGQLIEERSETHAWDTQMYLTYTLRNGTTVSRRYGLVYSTDAGLALNRWLSKPEYVLQTDDLSTLAENIDYITVEVFPDDRYVFTNEEALALLDAVIADCRAGIMCQDYYYQYVYRDTDQWGYLSFEKSGNQDVYICLWADAENTIAWLKDHGVEP